VASDAPLAFPFWVGSASIFLLSWEFSCLRAYISSALRFFRSAISCYILAWPSRMAAKSGMVPVGVAGPDSVCFVTLALLRVETIIKKGELIRKVLLRAPRWTPIVPLDLSSYYLHPWGLCRRTLLL